MEILWINFLVQAIALSVCLYELSTFQMTVSHAESMGGGSEWKSDPLTRALTDLDNAKEKLGQQSEEIERLKKLLNDEFITRREFLPVQRVVFGMVGLILSTALLSILVLIWRAAPVVPGAH